MLGEGAGEAARPRLLHADTAPCGIRAADVTAAVQSFGHDCGTGIDKTTPTPRPTATPSSQVAP
jgi:hypothetical protein